jgi:histidinol-phosphate aminotransferase
VAKINNCKSLLRKHILNIKPYSTARDEYKGTDASVFLNANENPYNILNYKYKEHDNIFDLNRYPDPTQELLVNEISKLKNIDTKNIFLGNGSDEATDILIRMFCEPGRDKIIVMPPTYGMYEVKATINGVETIDVPLIEKDNSHEINRKELFETIDTEPDAKILFICTPNNPTGGIVEGSVIHEILEKFDGLVVVDEAYIDFSDTKSFSSELENYSNLIVLQTLSKSWGLANLRIGICAANEVVIDFMKRIKPPCNISGLAQELAIDLLKNRTNKDEITTKIITERDRLSETLKGLNCVEKVFDSQANFLFVKFRDGNETYSILAKNGIIVRNRSNVEFCENCLRITVGTDEENAKLLSVLKNIE